ncbi:hypothetical protein PHYBOEH_008577 [Phytophthora boehmeriae]|uniref:Importin N-terminal domain-containing protein n=1 Tax=Phytophthora boehmeriae TaxID=109152 RepID=A0A8T1WZX6_9STRA|nr:hypothetical protein PHYBOEH_008577 [Phytophthora boehmeriae]
MAEQLAACARQLFEGVSGSDEQRFANAWLMNFQASDQAWEAALQLLEQPPRDPATLQSLAAPELVAMQILRLKTQQEWSRISPEQHQIVRQTLLKLLEATCVSDGGLAPVSCRIACVTVADIIVKSYTEWSSWKSDVQRLVDAGVAAQRQQRGAAVVWSVELHGFGLWGFARLCTSEEMVNMLTKFQAEREEVMKAVQMIISNIPEEQSNALRCLEGWVIGCVPTHETFGLNAAHIFSSGMMDMLFDIATNGKEEHSQLAAGIIADSFVCTVSDPLSDAMANAVHHAGHRLVAATPLFYTDVQLPPHGIGDEQKTVTCSGLSRIACSLAMNHAPALFSPHGNFNSSGKTQFPLEFMELLLACSAHPDADVVQPTLEIWFFFLEESSSQNEISLELFDAAGHEQIVAVLSRLVNSLVDHCKYPQSFIDTQQISSDDPEIEAIDTLRREIADTLLSLFSKWPGDPGQPKGDYVSCVMGMSQMLSDSKDVAMIDALLFLLSYLVELFDVVSSDSESEDDQLPLEVPASGGVDHHKADDACCRAGVQFFLNVIPFLTNGDTHHPIEAQILDVCMCWYGERIFPDVLTCCSRIITKQQGNPSFYVEAQQMFERLLVAFRAKLRDVPVAASDPRQQTMEDFLTLDNDADSMIPEVEQFLKLSREMLCSFPQVLVQPRSNGDPSLYWICLDLSTRLLKIDHQMQEVCDTSCDFLLDAMRCQPGPVLERIAVFATEIVRVVLGFLGPKRERYRVRNLWDFLFQCLHAPQISTQIRGKYCGFLSAITTVVHDEGALHSLLPPDVCQQLPGELRIRRQRHRFRQYFSLLLSAMET